MTRMRNSRWAAACVALLLEEPGGWPALSAVDPDDHLPIRSVHVADARPEDDAGAALCPSCHSHRIVPIIYGYPTAQTVERAQRGEVVLGGCVVTERSARWMCLDCERSFGPFDAPARSAPERVERCTLRPVRMTRDATAVIRTDREILDANVVCLEARGWPRVRLEGHTDQRSSTPYALALSTRLAEVVGRELEARGVDRATIEMAATGKEDPVCTEPTWHCHDENRRVEFRIVAPP